MVAKKPDPETVEFQETSEVSTEDRQLRVYDSKGDFIITVPAGCRVTFGYFNPMMPREDTRNFGADNVARQTALRIYRGKDNQIACFMGVKGFRDMSITLTRFTQKITVERTNVHDDESERWWGEQKRELVAKQEDEYQ